MVPDRQKVWTDGAKTISLLLRRGIKNTKNYLGGEEFIACIAIQSKSTYNSKLHIATPLYTTN